MLTEQTRFWIFVFLCGTLCIHMVKGYVEIEAASNACYDARSRTFNACSGVYDSIFHAPVDGIIEGVKLVHNSGAVQCYTNYHNYYTLSNWGLCAHVGVIIMSVTDETSHLGNILYPVHGKTDGLYYWFAFPSGVNDNDGTIPNSYEISGYNQESDYLIFTGHKYNVSKMDKFMLQYTEAYVQYSYSDNVGVGYASVYFLYADPTSTIEPTQVTHQSTSNVMTTNKPTTSTHTTLTELSSHNTVYPYRKLSIEIECVPEHGAGSYSWGTITGKCNCVDIASDTSETACSQSNIDWSTSYSVVIYSITNKHYIQPYYDDYYTTISDSGLWSRRIHLGYEYEVDLVEFEDKYNVIDTDSKDASEHDAECISSRSSTTNKVTTIEPTTTSSSTNDPTTSTHTTLTELSSHNAVYPHQKLSIEITCVPQHGAGPSSWGIITGKCNCVDISSNTSETACSQSNIDWSTSYSVVIYSITNTHYIQPYYNDHYTTISDSGLWSRRIHLGFEYEVALVKFEDKYTVIDTDLKDASEYDPECIGSGSSTTNQPTNTESKSEKNNEFISSVNSSNRITVYNSVVLFVFIRLMLS